MELTPDRAVEILEAQEFQSFVGVVEGTQIECKAAPYRLEEDRQKLELAKDVAGLANAAGGIIIIGLRTEPDSNRHLDIVRAVSSFESGRFDAGQYSRVIADWIYPPPNVQIQWFAERLEPGRGLALIAVRRTDEKPYIVSRLISDQGRRIEMIVGYFERQEANVAPMTAHRIQALLRDGMRFDEHLRELTESARREAASGLRSETTVPTVNLDERLDDAVRASELGERPTYILAAFPLQRVEIPGLVETRDSPAVALIRDPPAIRAYGFGVQAGRDTLLVRGALRRASGIGNRCLDVWRDGTVVFVGEGDGDFLCWSSPGDQQRVNPVVLSESTYLFGKLVSSLYALAVPAPTDVQFCLELRNATGVTMVPFQLGAIGAEHEWNRHTAPEPVKRVSVQTVSDADPRETAFALIRELYFWFGLTQDRMPYVTELPSGRRGVDPGAFTGS